MNWTIIYKEDYTDEAWKSTLSDLELEPDTDEITVKEISHITESQRKEKKKKAYQDIQLEPKVVLSVHSGCVEVDSKPDGVDIVIKDYDVEGSWDDDNIACKEDEYGRYQEMIF